MTTLKSYVHVFAPATIANMGPGFDVLGLAINRLGDEVMIEQMSTPGLSFTLHPRSRYTVPIEGNVVSLIAERLMKKFAPDAGLHLVLKKNMPLNSGLGSSGASSAAAAFAMNEMLGAGLSKYDLIPFAMEGERLASGASHADNVAPSLLGGLCLVRSYTPLDVIQLPLSRQLYWVVVHPHYELATKAARALLPSSLPLEEAVMQWGNLGALLAGLLLKKHDIISRSLIDVVAEPRRALLIPHFASVKEAAIDAGALACSISGSGPSLFAIATTRTQAKQIGAVMQQAWLTHAIASDLYISSVNTQGARIMEVRP